MTTRNLPAEWSPQEAIFLVWPHKDTDWGPRLQAIERLYFQMCAAITRYQNVYLICNHYELKQRLVAEMASRGIAGHHLKYFIANSNDTWFRDSGPISIYEHQRRVTLNFQFNAWGGKYHFEDDAEIIPQLQAQQVFGSSRYESIPLVLEGGSIDSDGEGHLLTTKHCLLAPTRNPTLTQNTLEKELKNILGIKKIFWLSHGKLAGDDTDSHVDMLARFVNTKTICYTACDVPKDIHYPELQAMQEELHYLRSTAGFAYDLIPLPWPTAKYNEKGERLPLSYANFLITNHAVLLPVYDVPEDASAIAIMKECFANREIIPIYCGDSIAQKGAMHCLSMQLPLSRNS